MHQHFGNRTHQVRLRNFGAAVRRRHGRRQIEPAGHHPAHGPGDGLLGCGNVGINLPQLIIQGGQKRVLHEAAHGAFSAP